ncbi:uncharacterized protein TA06905 [Theileria annulata]|uniref:Uncharacterized protein n=1 Tax=Theileria annulata TaxID=5874 RepID=Q4UHV2_THEAN|nr:uncharacterized protein TA06905 [Theileria annulata]CAI73337.1 hypothetical protein TA06905 [Theileria annulata]|eukprot:XP_954014.1 hypothetical protein TA06905 [Theileria annulata]
MDLSGDYSDLFNDESLFKVIDELDHLFPNDGKKSKSSDSVLPPKECNLKDQSYSINSTRYDTETSSVSLSDEHFIKGSSLWRSYQSKLDLHISTVLDPFIKYILETSITEGQKDVYFTKKKEYLTFLINQLVVSYKCEWKQIITGERKAGTEGINAEVEPDKGDLYQQISNEYDNLSRGITSSSSIETVVDNNIGNEDVIGEVYIELGHRPEYIELLYIKGMDYFYHFMDFLLMLIEKTSYNYKIVQALDLLTNVIKVMPELSILLVVPKNKGTQKYLHIYCVDSKILYEKRCYFKLLVKNVEVKLGLNNSVLDTYKQCLEGTFVPFYMTKSSEHDDLMEQLLVVYVLERLLSLFQLLCENLFEFVQLKLDKAMRTSISKKMKKYLFIPFLGIKTLHELFLPFSGNFEYKNLVKVDYTSLFKKYMYPPPPLYLLRLKLLNILKLLVYSGFVKYKGNFLTANRTIIQSEPISGMNQKVDKVLVSYFHMFSFGTSFLLMGEFFKRSKENIAIFFGNYLLLMPHFSLNYAYINENMVIEYNVYRLQRAVIDFLLALNESRVFLDENIMNVKSLNLTQNSVVKRILSLLIQYVTGTTLSEIQDAENDFNIDNEFNIRNRPVINCNHDCKIIEPYNPSTISKFLLDISCNLVDRPDDNEEEIVGLDMVEQVVDVCIYEEYDKALKLGLDLSKLYVPIENRTVVKYAINNTPQIKLMKHFTSPNVLSDYELELLHQHKKDRKPSSRNKEKLMRLDTMYTTTRRLSHDSTVTVDDGTTNIFNNLEGCGINCIINKHIIEEPRFKTVFTLRKILVMKLFETICSFPSKHLGDFEPIYISFLKQIFF